MAATAASVDSAPPYLRVSGVAKHFGGVRALKGVGLEIRPGEVHGLVGANGAGKSTLIRVLAGLERPDDGLIEIDGAAVEIGDAQAATALGLSFIHQELAQAPAMSVLQNIMLGSRLKTRFGMVDWRAIAADVEPIARRVGLTRPLNTKCGELSTAESWLVSICRALVHESRLIVMDEPTASLSAAEAERLFAIIRDLARSGVAVLYVSHRLDEILDLCDRVTVFRDGENVALLERGAMTRDALVEAIVGGHVAAQAITPRDFSSSAPAPALEVEGLVRLPHVRGVSFTLRAGEVLGLGGLVGAGRSELARLIFGADRPEAGAMRLGGAAYDPSSPAEAVAAGIGFVPEERRSEGLILTKSLAFNLSLANLDRIRSARLPMLIDGRARRALAEQAVRDFAIKASDVEAPVGSLSGGNQQKVVIGRWLSRAPRLLILDEPTRGVDVGARGEIHRLVRELAEQGVAVLAISSEPDELPELCDRVLVMSEGLIVQELKGEAVTRHAIVAASYAEAASGAQPSGRA